MMYEAGVAKASVQELPPVLSASSVVSDFMSECFVHLELM